MVWFTVSLLIKFTVFWFEYGLIYRPSCEYPSWGGEIEDPFFGGRRSGNVHWEAYIV